MYNKTVLDHFAKPHNWGKLANPDGVGKVGNIVCGDVMWLYIKVGKNKNREETVTEVKFETFGCVAAIATSSAITDLAIGKTLRQALEIRKDNVVKTLGTLPPIKLHCSVLAADALAEAIWDFLSKKGRPIPADLVQRHQRLQSEKKLIEEKYKDWIETEEKVHST